MKTEQEIREAFRILDKEAECMMVIGEVDSALAAGGLAAYGAWCLEEESDLSRAFERLLAGIVNNQAQREGVNN